MQEWLIWPLSKSGKAARSSRVRIPPLPPDIINYLGWYNTTSPIIFCTPIDSSSLAAVSIVAPVVQISSRTMTVRGIGRLVISSSFPIARWYFSLNTSDFVIHVRRSFPLRVCCELLSARINILLFTRRLASLASCLATIQV